MRPIDADALMDYCNNQKDKTVDANDIARFPTTTTTTAEMQLQMAIEDAEQFMKKAPYLGYDHAKNLIKAAKEVIHADKR